MKKRIFKAITISLIAVLSVMAVFVQLFTVRSKTAAAEAMSTQDIQTISVSTASAAEKRYVYDAGENKLMYNRVTGMVFSAKGVVYNQDCQPLTYNDKTEQFEDSLQRRLELVERSTGGLQNYYLIFDSYKVRSIGINDDLFIVGIAANTAFNKGQAYDMLITRVFVKYSFWDNFLAVVKGDYSGGYYEYYDLYGHQISSKYFEQTHRVNVVASAGTGYLSGTVFVKFEKWVQF